MCDEIGVQDAELADHAAALVGEERVGDAVRLRERGEPALVVVADREERVARVSERRGDPLQLDQLRLAVRSPPRAAVEHDERAPRAARGMQVDERAVLVGEPHVGEARADRRTEVADACRCGHAAQPIAGHILLPMADRRGATVELRAVTKRYADQVAVAELSFTVPAGRICALVGPSGSGKTTTLRMVNRLIEPTSGEIRIDGANVLAEDPTALRRRIGYVIQQVGLFPHQTIAENVGTVPRLLGWPRERIRARTEALLGLVGLDPDRYARRYPAQLSGGERQRAGVARALAAEPPVMLMDEPFGAVDPIVRERLQGELLRIQRDQGTTILFVTHDIDEAIRLGDRVAVLRDGRLVQYAPPGELLAHPADDFVAQFVGADRGLKRLGLLTAGGADLDQRVDRASVDPRAPVLRADTSLREALARMLEREVQQAVVLDGDRYLGVLTLGRIARMLRSEG
jgi:osmoprotectant transport system ATP-binding protein